MTASAETLEPSQSTLRTEGRKSSSQSNTSGVSLELRNVSKQYGKTSIVNNVSLSVEPGQFLTLLGASGSGKTTLLRIIAGFLEPTAGEVFVDGENITSLPVHRRKMGMVFQNYALFPHMSVYKNVLFPLARQKVHRSLRPGLVEEALEAVHLRGYEDRAPKELSGGQQQRVALARAIVAKPRLLLMDEPLGALDKRLREALQIEIRRLSVELGLTVINVTHDQEEALTMSDQIALLGEGSLLQLGNPEVLYGAPTNEATARFLGESNVFSGTIISDGTRSLLSYPYGSIYLPSQSNVPSDAKNVSVVVRPNFIRIAHEERELHSEELSRLKARVVASIFAGSSRKILVVTESNLEVLVRMDSNLRADFKVDESVWLAWNPEASVVVAT